MLRKLLLGLLLAASSIPALAVLSKSECEGAAQEIFAAQNVLNVDKAAFDAATAQIKKLSADDMGVTQELKDFVLSIAGKLKQGGDPQKAGMATYQGCIAKLKAI